VTASTITICILLSLNKKPYQPSLLHINAMSSSPAEFLTFYRHVTTSASMRTAMRSTAMRSFSTSRPQFLGDKTKNTGDMGQNTRHVLEKGEDKENNVQAYESNQGIK
jgi:hypothetical protein